MMGIITGLVLMFSFTFSGLVWLVRDVDRAVSGRAPAQAIAFQAARAGAQQIDPMSLRIGGPNAVQINPVAADRAARAAVDHALRSDGLSGPQVQVRVVAITTTSDQVAVVVEVRDGSRAVVGAASAQAVVGP
jgi:hypothetical protein